MAGASRRLTRLSRHNLTIDERASKIQMAIWPLAFHAAESQFIGESHFVKLRRQATDVLIGKHKYASSLLALSILSSKVEDPMLYVYLQLSTSFPISFPTSHGDVESCSA